MHVNDAHDIKRQITMIVARRDSLNDVKLAIAVASWNEQRQRYWIGSISSIPCGEGYAF
jgi:hypothetical protein